MANAMSTLSDDDYKRVETALSRVGVTADMFPSYLVTEMEGHAAAFDLAIIPADREHFKGEVIRLAALLLA